MSAADNASGPRPCVVQYFYVHSANESYRYTSTRGRTEPTELSALYLECALVQAASLALSDVDCELLFVSNLTDPHDAGAVGARGVKLIKAMEALGVQMRYAPYSYRLENPAPEYEASRYVLDAIKAVTATAPEDQYLWFTDLDCVWANPQRVFAAAPPAPEIACLIMDYPADWDIMLGTTPTTVGELGRRLGPSAVPAPWVGGELLGGTAGALKGFLAACDQTERDLGEQPQELPAEEHLFTIVGALGRVAYRDMTPVGRRLFTGRRHTGPKADDPATLGFWHLPFEKGLSFRRTANTLLAGRQRRVQRDFADPLRTQHRFNVGDSRLRRRMRDDAWLAANRLVYTAKDRVRARAAQGG